MRVIAGSARGRTLRAPRGLRVRPTADRARESLFGVLGEQVIGARVLDLYAGAGAVGIEALSRGAASVCFVERHAATARILRRNLEGCGFTSAVAPCLVMPVARALTQLDRQGARFELVFADPPYAAGAYEGLLERLGGVAGEQGLKPQSQGAAGALLANGALVVLEHFRKLAMPAAVGMLRRSWQRRVGETIFTAYGCES